MKKPTSDYYDKIASLYDAATAPENAWTPPVMTEQFTSSFVSDKTSRVLDIGIGTGQSIKFLQELNPNINIYGVDISSEMLKVCSSNYPLINLHHGNLESFKETGEKDFNVIIACGALEFIEDLESFFKEAKELLLDSGKLVFTFEPYIEYHPYQNEKKSLTVPDKNSSLYIEDCYTYRRTFTEIQQIIKESSMLIEDSKEFIAYKKGEHNIVYHVVRASKNV